MRCLILLLGLVVLVAAELELAEDCNETVCQPPNCRCSSPNIPGGLRPRDTPQFVTTTFDDGINIVNIETYRSILYDRRNSNGCPIGATFYISHEYTNYQLVNELYNRGYEIGLHSISHRTPQTYWAEATYDQMKEELGDQKEQMAYFANIPANSIKGVRIPFLQLSGNNSFQVMKDHDLQYDCSWATVNQSPDLWPYTLDYASTQDCVSPPCPTASIPGVWVQPMVTWQDLQGFPCAMVDACPFVPDLNNADDWFRFIVQNFERHYSGNRAPFGFYIHEAFFVWPGVRQAYIRFLDLLSNLQDVFVVNSAEVIEWIQNPVPLVEYRNQACRVTPPSPCAARTCALTGEHNNVDYWMTSCTTACPRVYPWVGNPLGA